MSEGKTPRKMEKMSDEANTKRRRRKKKRR